MRSGMLSAAFRISNERRGTPKRTQPDDATVIGLSFVGEVVKRSFQFASAAFSFGSSGMASAGTASLVASADSSGSTSGTIGDRSG